MPFPPEQTYANAKARALPWWTYMFLCFVQNLERCIIVCAFQGIATPHLDQAVPAHSNGVTWPDIVARMSRSWDGLVVYYSERE